MERKRKRRIVCGIGLLALVPAYLFAAAPLPPGGTGDLAAQVAAAPTIVIGRCSAAHADWDAAHRLIHTTATYEVERWVKGSPPLEQVRVRLLGGSVGEITQVAVGAPAARVGERVLLFLAPESGDRFGLVGWDRGKLTLDGDMILAQHGPGNAALKMRSNPSTPPAATATPATAIPVAALERLIRELEEQGADR